MTKQELLNIFSEFTREDWQNFDNIRNLAFQPTQEELETQRLEQEQYRQNLINSKLQAIGIAKPEIITKEFVLLLLEKINAKEWVGDNLSGWIDNQIELYGDIKTAFNDLVFTRL